MAKKRTGIPTLAYEGVEAASPPNIIQDNVAPSTVDQALVRVGYFNMNVCDLWLKRDRNNATPYELWMQVDKDFTTGTRLARWIQLYPHPSELTQLTGNAGTAPVVAGNINVIGAGVLSSTGDNVNTLSFAITAGNNGEVLTTTGGVAGWAALPAAGVDTLTTDAGVATEVANNINVLGGDLINTSGAGATVTINLNRGTDGQLIIAQTGATAQYGILTSPLASIGIVYNNPNIELESLVGSPSTYTLDDALTVSPDGGNDLDVLGGTSASGVDTNINTSRGAADRLDINLNNSIYQPNTDATGAEGMYALGGAFGVGVNFLHNYTDPGAGSVDNVWVGGAGHLTLNTNITGTVGIGFEALPVVDDTFGHHVVIGYRACNKVTTAPMQTVVGSRGFFNLTVGGTGGDGNTGMGCEVGFTATACSGNALFGQRSGYEITTGDFNSLFGHQSTTTSDITEGSFNIILGSYNAPVGGPTVDDEINIGAFNSAGVLQSNACYIAGISGQTAAGGVAVFVNGSHKLGTAVSSIRFKENIQPMGYMTEKLMQLNPVTYTLKKDKDKNQEWGLIAEEVEKIFPELVVYDDDGKPFQLRDHYFKYFMIKVMQEQQKEIEALKAYIKKKD